MVAFEQGPDELENRLEALRNAQPTSEVLMRSVHEVASLVKITASRAGDAVGIRMVNRREGVRITVIGPRAQRYKSLIAAEMERRFPQIKTEIRAQISRKTR